MFIIPTIMTQRLENGLKTSRLHTSFQVSKLASLFGTQIIMLQNYKIYKNLYQHAKKRSLQHYTQLYNNTYTQLYKLYKTVAQLNKTSNTKTVQNSTSLFTTLCTRLQKQNITL